MARPTTFLLSQNVMFKAEDAFKILSYAIEALNQTYFHGTTRGFRQLSVSCSHPHFISPAQLRMQWRSYLFVEEVTCPLLLCQWGGGGWHRGTWPSRLPQYGAILDARGMAARRRGWGTGTGGSSYWTCAAVETGLVRHCKNDCCD